MPRQLRTILLATCALLAAGCGAKHAAQPTATAPPGRPCPIGTDEARSITGLHDVKRIDLTPSAGLALRCSTTFAGPGGELVLSVTQANGGPARLARARAERATAREPARAVSGL